MSAIRYAQSLKGPSVWGKTALVQTGMDATGTSVASTYGTTASAERYVAHNQATAAADTSNDLGQFFTRGTIANLLIQARAPNGDTITARGYISGVAVGSPVTFSNTEWAAIDLGDYQFLIESDLQLGDDFTLRFSGGLMHGGLLLFAPRAVMFEAEDYLDTADGASSVSDSAAYGGNAVFETVVDVNADEKLMVIDDVGIDELAWPVYLGKVDDILDKDGANLNWGNPGGDYQNYRVTNGGHRITSYINDTYVSNWDDNDAGQLIDNGSYLAQQFTSNFATTTTSQGVSITKLTQLAATDELSVRVSGADAYSLAAFGFAAHDAYRWIDRLYLCRRTFDPFFDPEPVDDPIVTVVGSTVTLPFDHPDPGLIDHYEGFVWTADFSTTVIARSTITSPWNIDTTGFDPTETYTVVLVAVYAWDDSESYEFWNLTFSGFVPQIYRLVQP